MVFQNPHLRDLLLTFSRYSWPALDFGSNDSVHLSTTGTSRWKMPYFWEVAMAATSCCWQPTSEAHNEQPNQGLIGKHKCLAYETASYCLGSGCFTSEAPITVRIIIIVPYFLFTFLLYMILNKCYFKICRFCSYSLMGEGIEQLNPYVWLMAVFFWRKMYCCRCMPRCECLYLCIFMIVFISFVLGEDVLDIWLCFVNVYVQ